MTFDEQLRATLSAEAEARTSSPPDVSSLIKGGKGRRRRRTMARAGAFAAACVAVGGVAYGVSQVDLDTRGTDPGIAEVPTESQAPVDSALQDGNRRAVEPGTYRMFVGVDEAQDQIEADMTVTGTGWRSGNSPVVFDGVGTAGVGIHQVERVAGNSGCSGAWQGQTAAENPRALARQLSRLPMGTTLQRPTPVAAFGHDGLHLRVRIDHDCPAQEAYFVLYGAMGERGVTYRIAPTAVIIDFWVLDLDGTTVVVDRWHDIDAPQGLIDQATRARDSISFVLGE